MSKVASNHSWVTYGASLDSGTFTPGPKDSFLTRSAPYASRLYSWVRVTKSGAHTFFITARSGAQLFIAGTKVAEALRCDNCADVTVSGTATFSAGYHVIEVRHLVWSQPPARLRVEWEGGPSIPTR